MTLLEALAGIFLIPFLLVIGEVLFLGLARENPPQRKKRHRR